MTMSLRVGFPLPFATHGEGTALHYDGPSNTLMIVLNFSKPTVEEIESVRKGRFDFRMLATDVGLMAIMRFVPGIKWCDAPLEWSRMKSVDQICPELDKPMAFLILLADAWNNKNKIKVIRYVTPDEATRHNFNTALRMQAQRSTPPTVFETNQWFMGMRCHTSETLAAFAIGDRETTRGSEAILRFVFSDRRKTNDA